jgi:hypothetical protein
MKLFSFKHVFNFIFAILDSYFGSLLWFFFLCALIKVASKYKRVNRGIKNRVVARLMQLNQAQQLVHSIFLRAIISRFKDCDRRDTHAQQYWFRDPLAVLPRFRVPRTKLWMRDVAKTVMSQNLSWNGKWSLSRYGRELLRTIGSHPPTNFLADLSISFVVSF